MQGALKLMSRHLGLGVGGQIIESGCFSEAHNGY